MTTQQRIDVMLAADAGKQIQRRLKPEIYGGHGKWESIKKSDWNFVDWEYRLAPEPAFKYRLTYPDGSTWEHHDKDTAIARWNESPFRPALQKIQTNTTNE